MSRRTTQSIFDLPELVHHIGKYMKLSCRASLARSNRSMFRNIMPQLWKRVDGVAQISALLPVTEGLDKTEATLTNHFSGFDFSRLEIYVPWIEHLTLDLSEPQPSEDAVDILYYYSATRVLLPNLLVITSVSNLDLVAVSIPWLLPFLSPSLVSLELATVNYVEIAFPSLLVLLHTVSTRCLRLHTFLVNNCERNGLHMPISRVLNYAISDYVSAINEEIEHGPGRSLARISPLVCFTVSIMTLDTFCLGVIGAWPTLERLEVIRGPMDSYTLPEVTESAFPALKHLALCMAICVSDTLNMFWNVSALVRKLTSVKLRVTGILTLQLETLRFLSERSPYIRDLWIRACDVDTVAGVLDTPISALDVLQQLTLQTLHLEGLRFTECENVPHHLIKAFPQLKMFGLPNHVLGYADLRTFQTQMPDLEHLSLSIEATSLSPDLDIELSDVVRYRRAPLLALELNFLGRNRARPYSTINPYYNYNRITLLVQ
ncbi:hypothetical protein FRC12_020732 [Ceratobasidium sp. 428]|nr:hypothetical protein FRC12_020732 [Ceratobasidium sp. 428]